MGNCRFQIYADGDPVAAEPAPFTIFYDDQEAPASVATKQSSDTLPVHGGAIFQTNKDDRETSPVHSLHVNKENSSAVESAFSAFKEPTRKPSPIGPAVFTVFTDENNLETGRERSDVAASSEHVVPVHSIDQVTFMVCTEGVLTTVSSKRQFSVTVCYSKL